MPATASGVQIIDISSGPFSDHRTCSNPKAAFLQGLADHGINTIIRYYSDEDNLPCKNVTPHERKILHDHGFFLAIVYQFKGREPGRYSKQSGVKDAAFCLKRAKEMNQPEGSAIYFGIDADTGTHDLAGVLAYLDEINKAFNRRFLVGCYAAGTICKAVLEKGLATFTWVPEAPAWSGTRAFMNSGNWTFYQNKTDMKRSGLSKGHGIEVDTDIVNPKFDTIGAFDKDGTLVKYKQQDVEAIANARKWVNRLQMPLLDSPNGQPKGHMCIARMVHVLSAENGWALVDIDEDGQSDGYCLEQHLSPLAQMPEWTSGCSPMPL